MNKQPTVFLVDDEPDVRASLGMLIKSVGLKSEIYESPQSFLDAYDPDKPGCLILDLRMPGMSGLDLQKKLAGLGHHPPIIMISGHGEIPTAVQAVQSGAIDFLQKPVSDQLLLDRIQQAISQDEDERKQYDECQVLKARYATLTPRELEVMQGVIDGKLNKTIASDLNVSTRTIEIHRSRVMEKMQADSLSALVQMASQLNNCNDGNSS